METRRISGLFLLLYGASSITFGVIFISLHFALGNVVVGIGLNMLLTTAGILLAGSGTKDRAGMVSGILIAISGGLWTLASVLGIAALITVTHLTVFNTIANYGAPGCLVVAGIGFISSSKGEKFRVAGIMLLLFGGLTISIIAVWGPLILDYLLVENPPVPLEILPLLLDFLSMVFLSFHAFMIAAGVLLKAEGVELAYAAARPT